MIVSDDTAARSICVQKRSHDKSVILSKHALLSYNGDPGDAIQFAEYIRANINLYSITNGVDLSVKASANFTRRLLADALRTKNAYQVNLLLSGFDVASNKGQLYWLDHLASLNKVNYAAHGYASYFLMSVLDLYWTDTLDKEQAVLLVKKCLQELKIRFMGNLNDYIVKIVDKDGVNVLQI